MVGEPVGDRKVSPGSLRPTRPGSGLGPAAYPLSMRRSDTVSTEDKEEEDGEKKNYGEEKLWGRRAAVREAVKYQVGGVINATFHSFIRPPPSY